MSIFISISKTMQNSVFARLGKCEMIQGVWEKKEKSKLF